MSLASQNDPTATSLSLSPSGRPVRTLAHRGVRVWWLRWLLALVIALPALAVSTSAHAAPTIQQLQKKIQALRDDAEAAAERYNGIQTQLKSIRVRVKAAQDRQAAQQKQVEAARRALGAIAAERYRQGDLAVLSLLFSNDPDALLAQSGLMSTLGDREAAAVKRLVHAQNELKADGADLMAQKLRLEKVSVQANAARKDANTKVAAAQAQLNRLTAAQRAAVARASRGDVRESTTCGDINVVAPDSRTQKVIDYACVQAANRVPYVWGGDSPSGGFDCSGLTMMAWKQAGVSLPHLASAQYSGGTHVSMSSIRPGDLVFRSSLGHVGIYIGNGLMIHAPHTGDVVRVASVSGMSLAARY